MTFREKLSELHQQSLTDQQEFLKVIEEIRACATKGEPLAEELLYRRDKLYNQFNKVLKLHRRLINYTEENNVSLDSEYSENAILI
jgi:hypothetical protein